MSAGGTTTEVTLGPGRIYIAAVGTTAPTSASAALPSAWWSLGYTEDGTTVDIELTSEAIEVAEELDPIDYVLSARAVTIKVQCAQVTKKRLAVALALGAGYTDDGAYLDLPDGSVTQTGVSLVWDSAEDPTDGTNRRWYIPKVLNAGTVSIARQKAPSKALLPLELKAVKVTSDPLARVFPNASGLV